MKGKHHVFAALLLGILMLLPAVPAQAHGFRSSRVVVGWGGGSWGWRGGWGWGWGWGYPGYYYPAYGYPAYGYAGYGYPYGPAVFARVKTDVDPEEAALYLDGRLIGTADDFDGYPDYLYLKRGHYRLEFRLEGYEPQTVDVDARPGTTVRLTNKLAKIPGAKQYGSYDQPKITGGIQRFWGKRRDADVPVDPSAPPPDSGPGRYSVAPPQRNESGEPEQSPPEDWRSAPPRGSVPHGGSSPRSAEKSRLSFSVSPPDAAVYVDDRFVGTAEEVGSLQSGLSVAPGKHTVTVSRPGFQDQFADVEVVPGGAQRVEISLKHQ